MSGCVRIPLDEYCESKGIEANKRHFMLILDVLRKSFGLVPKRNGPWLAGSSLHLLFRDDDFRDNKTFFNDFDFFFPNFASFKKYKKKLYLDILGLENSWVTNTAPSDVFPYPHLRRWRKFHAHRVHCERGLILDSHARSKTHELLDLTLVRPPGRLWQSGKLRKNRFLDVVFPQNIQLIGFHQTPKIENLLNKFDINVCAVGFDGTDLVIRPDSLFSLKDKSARLTEGFENLRNPLKTNDRVGKYMNRGFTFPPEQLERLGDLCMEFLEKRENGQPGQDSDSRNYRFLSDSAPPSFIGDV